MAGDQRPGGRRRLKQYHRFKIRMPGRGRDGEVLTLMELVELSDRYGTHIFDPSAV